MLQLLFWAGVACYNPYIVVFLSNRGVSSTSIGLILMVNSILTVVSQPMWGYISDRIHSIRKVFCICIFTAALLIVFLPIIKSLSILAIILPLIALMQSPLSSLLDTWTFKSAQDGVSTSYGAVRLWGSIGFAIIVTVMGMIATKANINIAFLSYAVINSMTVLVSFRIKDINRKNELIEVEGKAKGSTPSVFKLIKNYRYLAILFFMSTMYIVVNPMLSFLPKLMVFRGGSTDLYGLAMAASALSEVPVLLISGILIKKIRPLHLILISSFFYTIRIIIYSTVVTPAGIIAVQCLQGLSFAFLLLGSIHYIDSLAPEGLKSTAQTAAVASYFGLGGMIGNSLGGSLIDSVGIISAYRIGAAIQAAVFILFTCYVLFDGFISKRNQSYNLNQEI